MGRRVININGENYFEGEDDKDDDRTINISGGTYTQRIQGDVVQGSVIKIEGNNEVWWEDQPSQSPRQDYSGSDAIDVDATPTDQPSQSRHTKPWWMD
jgi:hypothetical protein